MDKFQNFISLCTQLRLQTTNCRESQVEFSRATTVAEAVAAFRKFWVSVVDQIPAEFSSVLAQCYPDFRREMNSAGIYFNEPPANPANAVVFVGDCNSDVSVLSGRPRVIVLGAARVEIADHVRCECYNDMAEITCRDFSRLKLNGGTAIAYNRSTVEGSGCIYTHDFATAYVYGGELHDSGHTCIKAYNNVYIHSYTNRKIDLFDQAQLSLYE